ncbi:hypothetical protein [Ruegeria atlantica]|uniref:hypothetical protein n=1 Tax=Ruegeria atlantica TaxID=81569 RepID=UPI00147C0CFA|nr:hypothetical protein [Ruegeria atlantica]
MPTKGRKPHKARSDSFAAANEAANKPDLSLTMPELETMPGSHALSEWGVNFARNLWLSRERWTVADLSMICQAALTAQRLHEMADELATAPLTVMAGNGAPKPNPIFAIADTHRARLQLVYRDLGVRFKDRDTRAKEAPEPDEMHVPQGRVADWLNRLQSGAQKQ